ncbi:MAG: hypothetical protein M3277_08200 [Actinomycetota bacterium]|nr:hypothetical protein [Actinomycetota bacterium]
MHKTTIAVISAALLAAATAAPAAAIPPTPLAPRSNVEYVGGDNTSSGGHVVIEGKRMYVGAYGLGMKIYDISDPESPVEIGSYMPGNLRADAVPDAMEVGKRHIAVLNGTNRVPGTQRADFLDVTDPENPEVLATFEGPEDGESHNGDIVDARKLWIPSGNSPGRGLRVYDLRPLLGKKPKAPKEIFAGDPWMMWQASPYRMGKPEGNPFTHTHDVTIYLDYEMVMPRAAFGDNSLAGKKVKRDIALLAEGGSYASNTGNTGSIFVIDITDPKNPVVLYRWLHETGGNHHPIRYHHEAQFLDSDPRVMLVTDEDLHNGCGADGGMVAVRLSDTLTSGKELSEWFIPMTTPAPVCSAHVFSSHKNLVFMGSYNAGLQVIDYKNPAQPEQAGYFLAEGTTAWGAQYHKGLIYVGDFTRGLDVFRFTKD